MYRSAPEQLLEDHGYAARMVGPKLKQLNEEIAQGTAPKWAIELDPEFLSAITRGEIWSRVAKWLSIGRDGTESSGPRGVVVANASALE
jgi:hypothetical protein